MVEPIVKCRESGGILMFRMGDQYTLVERFGYNRWACAMPGDCRDGRDIFPATRQGLRGRTRWWSYSWANTCYNQLVRSSKSGDSYPTVEWRTVQ